ncbi:hypothetical protein DFH06DRAFT_1213630, partial [Mycena polygramma]
REERLEWYMPHSGSLQRFKIFMPRWASKFFVVPLPVVPLPLGRSATYEIFTVPLPAAPLPLGHSAVYEWHMPHLGSLQRFKIFMPRWASKFVVVPLPVVLLPLGHSATYEIFTVPLPAAPLPLGHSAVYEIIAVPLPAAPLPRGHFATYPRRATHFGHGVKTRADDTHCARDTW